MVKEKLKIKRETLIFASISLLILISDFFTKLIIKKTNLITTGHWIDISPIFNKGSLFGLFSNIKTINIIFILISLLVITGIIYLQKNNKKLTIGLGIILGGVLGNLIDRIINSKVFDFINIHFWPVFNIADSAILIGIIFLIIKLRKE